MSFEGVGTGWFSEVNDMWKGIALSLKIDKLIYKDKTKYQDIAVFDSETFGRVLLLDGVIQLTTRDEFSYQEMISHLPLCSLQRGEGDKKLRVCVVGGGDGGVLREVCRHEDVEIVDLAEIDEGVI